MVLWRISSLRTKTPDCLIVHIPLSCDCQQTVIQTRSRRNRIGSDLQQCSNYRTISLISHASKVMLKIIMKRIERKLEAEINVVQAYFDKACFHSSAPRMHWTVIRK